MDRGERKFVREIELRVGRAINTYGLAGAGDRLLVALSGGKDSLALLEILAGRRKRLPITYEVIAAHVSISSVPYEIDREAVEAFCRELGVPFHCRRIEIDLKPDDQTSICFLCSWHRRKALFDMMKELSCTRLVFGHNLDDIVETLLLNMVFQGSIGAMPPKLALFGGEFEVVRPLALVTEAELVRYARIRNFPVQTRECPFSRDSRRDAIREMISGLEKINPDVRSSIFRAMTNIKHEYLPGYVKK